jgi:uncharacterized protein (DUF427 family)
LTRHTRPWRLRRPAAHPTYPPWPAGCWPRAPRRVRLLFAGRYVADTTAARYVWEDPYYPWYYVPAGAFAPGVFTLFPEEQVSSSSSLEKEEKKENVVAFAVARLAVGDRATDRVLVFPSVGVDDVNATALSSLSVSSSPLRGLVRVEFGAIDAWFEEDERIYVHPRDPYKRIDILRSTRPVRVLVRQPAAGQEEGVEQQQQQQEEAAVVVANAAAGALHLYETGLPVRYYLPPTAVDWSLLRESNTTTECPYKSVARYYHVVLKGQGAEETVLRDVVWYYRDPTHESAQIAGALCFYNEKVDIELDGRFQERTKTHFA